MRFNKKIKTIFLDPQSHIEPFNERVNIVVSPSLYWVKKLSLPVKYVRDAKKLLPSLFEDSIKEGNYSYYVYKEDGEFFCFAYEDKVILELLKQKGISTANIANIYFAQSELQHIQTPLKIDAYQTLIEKDGIVIVVPSDWVEESKDLDLKEIKHSKHTISLAQYNHIVDKKSFYKIGTILVVFIGLLFGEYFITQQKLDKAIAKQEDIFTKYHLKPTLFQNRSLLKKYKKLHTKQMKIREGVAHILALRLQGDDKLTSITLKEKKIVATFSGVKKNEERYIKNKLQSKKVNYQSFFKKDNFYVEVAL